MSDNHVGDYDDRDDHDNDHNGSVYGKFFQIIRQYFEQIIRHFAKSSAMTDGPMAFHEHCNGDGDDDDDSDDDDDDDDDDNGEEDEKDFICLAINWQSIIAYLNEQCDTDGLVQDTNSIANALELLQS